MRLVDNKIMDVYLFCIKFSVICKPSLTKEKSLFIRLLNHCDVSEEVQLRSKIHSFCSEMQKDGNTSPYLLSTIMDLDKDEGLKNKDIAKLGNAVQVI